ncbi:MAG TPA: tryptophan--tRNA ligase [Thermoanaerobaculales bacterium]|nr:tryptophan--tRNA ligase [Thermoanaerobaculales bacterium]HPA81654.1 tryptophan--tRNA ligase [Thermoanaerobaculales bacterium]HQN96521.1 tryptophan--tRNA ligase [Thermoanaerobaculales bacterium]HQP44678.1 tryptophan--tRNA ligase [Thermoanaerobaculales bacterium]
MRVLSGVQPSGALHIGNYFGAIRQFVELQHEHDCCYFLADLHALTSVHDAGRMRGLVADLATSFLALGLDPGKAALYRQSDLPEVPELTWYLSTVTSMGLLQRCHSFKDKVGQGVIPSHGLFAYPVLMAADVLIVRADVVPVGRDQKQHLEVTRDIVASFHTTYGCEVFTMPEPLICDEVAVVPGLDGQKMSKSYGNTIDLFGPEKEIRSRIMSITTDSTPVEAPKPKQGSALYGLLKLFAPAEDKAWVEAAFDEGGTGYGEMKKRLFAYYMATFGEARRRFEELRRHPGEVEAVLAAGAERARAIAVPLLDEVRAAVGIR